MSALQTCCWDECGKPAEYSLRPLRETTDPAYDYYDISDACVDHVGHLLQDAPAHEVIPVEGEFIDSRRERTA